MYYVNRYPQFKNPLVPDFTTNAKYNNAGFTITATNGTLSGNAFGPFDGTNWTSADAANSYLQVKFPRPVIVTAVSFNALDTPRFNQWQIQGSNTAVDPWDALTTQTFLTAGFNTFPITNNNSVAYTYIRFFGSSSTPLGTGAGLSYLQYFGIQM